MGSSKEQKGTARINVHNRPENLSMEEWQRALRRQIAEQETFGIEPPHSPDEPFVVGSASSGRQYNVFYYNGFTDGRCDCMDFKTSCLGTCKHIEAIKAKGNGRFVRKAFIQPLHTYIYVDYPKGRRIRIRIGSVGRTQMTKLAATIFDCQGELKDMRCNPSQFIREARKIDPEFRWEDDALNLIIDHRDKARREAIVREKYKDSDYKGLLKTKLHPYQADGVRFAFTEGRTINADEMGLGKTVQAIATAELLRKEGLISNVLIVCPTSLKYQWLAEIKRFTDSSVLVIEGNFLKRQEQFADSSYFYKICSFHAISNSIKGGVRPSADLVIYDELQRLKNKDTQMGKQLRKLESQYVMALSGTPLENKLDELYSVTQLVDQFILGPYYKFTADTTLKDETGKIVGYKNLHQISERLSHTLIRRRKVDVKLQMPGRTDTILPVPMTMEQRAIHEEYKLQVAKLIHKWRRFKFLGEADRRRMLQFLSMMRMVCDSTFVLDQKTRHDTKIDEVKAIIANMLDEGDGKVVIFSQWERMLRVLAGELTDFGIDFCFLHGGVPSPKRKDLIDRFRDDPKCRIFLSTDAGATGLNLQSASLLINLDLPWNPAVLEQRIARIYRLGQKNPVQIINMVAKDTIEERMLATLAFKSNLAAGILDGGEDAVFIDNNKFDKIVETVDSVLGDQDAPAKSQPKAEAEPKQEAHDGEEPQRSEKQSQPQTATTSQPSRSETDNPSADKPKETASASTGRTSATEPKSPQEIRDVVAGGLTALGKIAGMLQDADSTRALVDAIVKEDPQTGATTLNIPVPDKNSFVNILSAFSACLKSFSNK